MVTARLGKTLLFILLLSANLMLSAVSLAPETGSLDPFGSQSLLSDWDFLGSPSAEEIATAEKLIIQIVTMGKGDPLYVWFGHSAIVVTDLRNGRKVMYDYGVFSFDDDFYQTFAMGRLYYEVWATSAEARYDLAEQEDRDIRLLTLDLSPQSKLALVKFLNFNILPENQTYLYHHYNENCATRIRDIINSAVGGQFKSWAQSIPSEYTIRQHMMRHTSFSPFVDWVLNFLQSGRIDTPISLWEAMFLPAVMEQALKDFSYTDDTGTTKPLVMEQEAVYTESLKAKRTPVLETYQPMVLPAFYFAAALGFLAFIFTLGFLRTHSTGIRRLSHVFLGLINWSWSAAVGICSTVLFFMVTFTSHDVTYGNENLVFANPWLLVMSIWSFQVVLGNRKALVRFQKSCATMSVLTLLLILAKGLFPDFLIQQNWAVILPMLPLYLLNSGFSFQRLYAFLNREDPADIQKNA